MREISISHVLCLYIAYLIYKAFAEREEDSERRIHRRREQE